MKSPLDCPKCGRQLEPHCQNYACNWLRCTWCVVLFDTEGKAHEDRLARYMKEPDANK